MKQRNLSQEFRLKNIEETKKKFCRRNRAKLIDE